MTLTENRRQVQGWEKLALDAIREGRPVEALAAYRERGSVAMQETADQLQELMVADWLKAREAGEDARMIARRRQEVVELNRRGRAALKERGQIAGPELELDGGCFAVGDEVVTRQNDRRLGVLNGTSGLVDAVDHERGQLALRIESGREIELPAEYLQGQRPDGIPYAWLRDHCSPGTGSNLRPRARHGQRRHQPGVGLRGAEPRALRKPVVHRASAPAGGGDDPCEAEANQSSGARR